MKQVKFLILGALFLIAGFLLGYGLTTQQQAHGLVPALSQSAQHVSIMVDTGSELLGFPNIAVAQEDTAWSLLEAAAKQYEALSVEADDYGDLGVLIQSINGYENGVNNQYWQFWVNNKYADIAASNYQILPRDVILWKFTSSLYQAYE